MDSRPLIDPVHVDNLPGEERALDRKPEWHPRYPGSGRLAGKVALVTGGDSGIGRAVAVLFAREGADVAFVHLPQEQGDAADTRSFIEAEGRRALAIPGDVGSREFCHEAVERVAREFGRLDVLVNNASEQHEAKDIADISEEQLRRTFQTNVFGYFFMVQAALSHLRRGASIVNTVSITAYQGSRHLLDYSATKGAETAFTRSLAKNLVERGIRVNAVAPGPIWTPLNPFSASEEKLKTFGQDTPMGRPGQPNEVAPAYLFLACEDGSYVTGQTIHVNGGEIVNG
jgi:NAD(P)-dependent dehydrogenase (short-subunit alcohol dehydrogenase family)